MNPRSAAPGTLGCYDLTVAPVRAPRRTRFVVRLLVSGGLVCAFAAPIPALASPPDDEWTIETKRDDKLLVQQRFAKLRKSPFDAGQWRALERAVGKKQLVRRIMAAHERAPNDVSLAILDARASLALGDPGEAASKLAAIEPRAGRWAGRVFAMRVDALESAKSWREAVDALEQRASDSSGDTARKHLNRAYMLADRGHLEEDALRLAQTLLQRSPKDVDALLRVASAATATGDHALADQSYADAIEKARPAMRNELTARRARARMEAGSASEAAGMVWTMLRDPGNGRGLEREAWWDLLASAHRQAASSEVLARQLEAWLAEGKHAREAAAWRTLARAQEVAGIDPIPAWRRALEAEPRDADSRARLIEALEATGDSDGALDEYRKLVARSPNEAQLGLDMAMRLITNGEKAAGLEVAREIEARAGKREHTLLLLLEFYNDLEESSKALEIARKLVRSHPRNADARVALGEQLYQMGHHEEALEHWSQLPKLVRPSHAGWARYAEILSEHATPRDIHMRRRSQEALKKALAGAPEQPRYLRLQALLEEELRRTAAAYELWEKVRQFATSPEDRLLREEARTRVVELLVSGGQHFGNRARVREKAVLAARNTLRGGASPEALEAGLFLAELYTREENYGEAVARLLEVNEMFPDEPELLMQLASAERRDGQIEQAMETLRQVMEVDPSRRADVLTELSELSFRAGDVDAALATATRAAAGGADGRRALIRLGELHERNGDLDRAEQAYQTALESDPHDPRARLHIAELQLTRGDVTGSAATLAEVLERGGPPDLLRRAGQRALDLAEARGDTAPLLALAIKRTKREPEADEPREFLLDTLDRTDPAGVDAWLRASGKARDDARVAALRRPLVASLNRGSIGLRLRAAEHLGRLGLPETAPVLARMGAQLTTPNNATQAVKAAFEDARSTAIEAAGSLHDPSATPILVEILDHRRYRQERISAAWALAQNADEKSVAALRKQMSGPPRDAQVLAMACLGVGQHSRGAERAQDRVRAAEIAKRSQGALRHACTFAEASLMTDRRAVELTERLDDSDPIVAAIAAWRLGQSDRAGVDSAVVEALLRRYLGPPGLARDAAGAALARLLGDQDLAAKPLPPLGGAWEMSVSRWLTERVAPAHEPIAARALEPYREQLANALRANASGTPAERLASERARRSCADAGEASGDEVCLAPLVEGSMRVPIRVDN
jgi:tetratricopeptide (TPR) repeat protein